LGVRFGDLTVENLRPWGGVLAVASIGAWAVLFALDSPYADVVMLFLLSFALSTYWMDWSERRAKRTI
jgi:membrane protein implicated in regulation of membrane protease activity